MSNMQQFLHLDDDTAKRITIIDHEAEARRKLEQQNAAMAETIRLLAEALIPFANVGDRICAEGHDVGRQTWVFVVGKTGEIQALTVGDWLRASKAVGGG